MAEALKITERVSALDMLFVNYQTYEKGKIHVRMGGSLPVDKNVNRAFMPLVEAAIAHNNGANKVQEKLPFGFK